jgi:tRNA 5-methylaminomethyl-2-thiouridine biosynthesis bifunctional protein
MPEPVEWLPDGTPRNPRWDDIYRSAAGGLEQARHAFLHGCDLPAAWAAQPQWRILETGFGLGLNFLAVWRAWQTDPQRPRLLHVSSIEAWPVAASDLLRSAAPYPELLPLAQQLAAQWFGLVPGFHRFVFEGGQVLLTLCVGDVKEMLRAQDFSADAVFLDGFSPARNPQMWDLHTLKAVARLCRRGARLASWTAVGQVRQDLAQCGFVVRKAEGLPPKRHSLLAVFDPVWQPKGLRSAGAPAPGRCVVIGAGLAGAAVAASLARRGWQVLVLDAAMAPAAGASGLPAGLLVPHYSPDDNLLSRLTRSGMRLTLQQATALLRKNEDWQDSGVLEHRVQAQKAPTAAVDGEHAAWSCVADLEQKRQAQLPDDAVALWHPTAAWIKPAALVHAWLRQPGVSWHGGAQVDRIVRHADSWQIFDASAALQAQAELVVVAAANASAALVPDGLQLQPIRGQVTWATREPGQVLPPFPVNGSGYFIPAVPLDGQAAWLCGATFGREETDLAPRVADAAANLQQLLGLLPASAAQLEPAFAKGAVRAWTGVRCAATDRRPLLGEAAPGLWLSTAMGSRGLTFAVLCAELLAARLHGEPLPVPRKLAAALDVERRRG